MDFRKFLKGEEAFQSYLSVFCIFHPNVGAPRAHRPGCTAQNLGLSGRTLASDDSVAQRCGNRDEIEVRASASHRDARDGHSVQRLEATISVLLVVELKSCYSARDDLRLCIRFFGLVINKHHEDEGSASVDQGEICLNNMTSFATHGERNGEMWKYGGATLVKVQEPQRFGGKVGKETLFGGTGGEI